MATYTATGQKTVSDLNEYKQIALVPLESASNPNIVQAPAILPVALFKTHGYLQAAISISSGNRFFAISYVNDTTINCNSITSGFAIEAYGVK